MPIRRVTPGSGPRTRDVDPDARRKPIEPTDKPSGSSSYRGATRSRDRKFKPGATVLDAVVPKVYGTAKVPGYLATARKWSGFEFVWVFSIGEQTSIDKIEVFDHEVYPNPHGTPSFWWWKVRGQWLGDGTAVGESEVGRILDRYCLSTAEKDLFGTLCGVAVAIDDDKVYDHITGPVRAEAIVGGQKVWDYRTSTWVSSTNPALIAYELLTDSYWLDLPAATVGSGADGTWIDAANYFDEAMSDATERYSFSGVIDERDPDKAIAEVLKHAFAETYYDESGVIQIRHAGPAYRLSGDWTASTSTLMIEDGEDEGTATTDLAVNDWVILGTAKAKVVSITSDHRVVVDRVLAETSEKLRKLTDVEIKMSDWLKMPRANDVPAGQIPDEVIVRYMDPEDWSARQYPDEADITGDKRVEIKLDGCVTKSNAKRYSLTSQRMAEFQAYSWSGSVGEIGARLKPGMIVVFETDILEEQLAKVVKVRWNYRKGIYDIELREFDPAAFSEDTEAEDTPPTIQPDDADIPTAYTRTFGEKGNWDNHTIFSNPDDISAWTWDSGLSASYDAVDDETEITFASGTSGWKYGRVEITSDLVSSEDVKTNVLLVTLMKRWVSGIDGEVRLKLEYWAGADYASSTRQGSCHIVPFDDDNETLERIVHQFEIADEDYHDLRIGMKHVDPTYFTTNAVVAVKRLRAVTWGINGEPIDTPYDNDPNHVTSLLGLYERHTWTPHASSDDTVAYYGLQWSNGRIINEVQQDEDSVLQRDHASTLQKFAGLYWSGKSVTCEKNRSPAMVAIGQNGKPVGFPAPTVAYESPASPPQITAMGSLNYYGGPGSWGTMTYYPRVDSGPPAVDTTYEIPEAAWSDYYLELWIDEAGGTDYELWSRAEWGSGTYVGYTYDPSVTGHGAAFQMGEAPAGGFSHVVRITGKYSGKSTDLVSPGTTWYNESISAGGTDSMKGVATSVTIGGIPGASTESALGPHIPLEYLESESNTNDRWLNVLDLPAYDASDAHATLFMRIRSRGDELEEWFEEEFYISNEDEATEATVRWVSTGGSGVRQFKVEIWRQADKTDQIWVKAEQDPSALTIETMWLESNVGWPLSYPQLVRIDGDENSYTTTAPSTGTKGFDSDTDDPDVEWSVKDSSVGKINGAEIVTDGDTKRQLPRQRVDDGGDSSYRKWVNLQNDHAGYTGALCIRPFGNSAPSDSLGVHIVVNFNHANSAYNGVGELHISGLWLGTGDWDTTKNWAEWAVGRANSATQSNRVRLMQDASGYPCIVIGNLTDVNSASCWDISSAVINRSGASSYDLASSLTTEYITATTSFTTNKDFLPPYDFFRLHGFNTQIAGLTEEASPSSGDWLLGELAAGGLRKVDVGNLPGGSTTAPKTTAVTVDSSASLYVNVGVWQTIHEETSGGPWIIHEVQTKSTAGGSVSSRYRLTIDGTVVHTDTANISPTTGDVVFGLGALNNVFGVFFARSSFKVEVDVRSGTNDPISFYTVYQAVSIT